jgi:hypothetical protein
VSSQRRETAVVSAVLAALCAAVLGRWVAHGGFASDDWSLAALTKYPGPDGLLPAFWKSVAYRPVAALYLPAEYLVFDEHPSLHILWTLLLATAGAVLLYAVLRRLGFQLWHAGAIAALVLLFPGADSTRLWVTGNLPQLAVTLCLGGLLLALRGLELAPRGRRAAVVHAPAVLLYAASVLTYEATAPPIALFGVLYRLRSTWRAAGRRWAADLVAVGLALAWNLSQSHRRAVGFSAQTAHARQIAEDATTLFARSLVPYGTPRRSVVLSLVAVVVLVTALLVRSLARGDRVRTSAVRWLSTGLAGVVFAAAGWVMFVPTTKFYAPLSAGFGNRTNAVASIGLVLAVYAVLMLVGTIAFRLGRRPRALGAVLPALLVVVVLVGYAREVRSDTDQWTRAVARERNVLSTLARIVPATAHGDRIYTFGQAGYESAGIPIFHASWDLTGAVTLRWKHPPLAAYPVIGISRVVCDPRRVHLVGPGWNPRFGSPYGKTIFVDLSRAVERRIASASQCRTALTRFRPGPLVG